MVREDREDDELLAETGRAPRGGKKGRSLDDASPGTLACYECGQARDFECPVPETYQALPASIKCLWHSCTCLLSWLCSPLLEDMCILITLRIKHAYFAGHVAVLRKHACDYLAFAYAIRGDAEALIACC